MKIKTDYSRRAGAEQIPIPPVDAVPGEPVASWKAAFDEARDAILNDRGPLEGEGMSDSQTNAVLAILDGMKPPVMVEQPQMPSEFLEYVKHNYNGEVVFSDPRWHAVRLWRAAMSTRSAILSAPQAAPVASRAGSEPGVPRLIGWRSDDYLNETSDPAMAKNWEPHMRLLPIFEGDPHTKLTDRAAQPAAQSPALLFAHDDGRHAVAHAGAAFLQDDPAWHRVGPVEVYGAQSPQGAPVAYLHPITHPNWLDVCEPGSPGAFPVFAAPQGGESEQASTASDLTDAIMHAVTSCSHSIDREQIVLRFDAKNPGHNALNQLHRRIGTTFAQASASGRSEHAEPVALTEGKLLDLVAKHFGHCNVADLIAPRMALARDVARLASTVAGCILQEIEYAAVHGWPTSTLKRLESMAVSERSRGAPQPLLPDAPIVETFLHGAPESARQPLTMIQKSALFDTECAVTFTVWDDFIAGIEAAERTHGISATAMKAAGARE